MVKQRDQYPQLVEDAERYLGLLTHEMRRAILEDDWSDELDQEAHCIGIDRELFARVDYKIHGYEWTLWPIGYVLQEMLLELEPRP